MSGERETQPRGNCRETSASRSVEVNGQDLRRSCPIDRCFGSHLSSLASRVRRVSPNPLAKSPLSLKTTHYLVLRKAAQNGPQCHAPPRATMTPKPAAPSIDGAPPGVAEDDQKADESDGVGGEGARMVPSTMRRMMATRWSFVVLP